MIEETSRPMLIKRALPYRLFLACVALPIMLLGLHGVCTAQDCNPKTFGAKADGVTKDTAAIQRAIDTCSTRQHAAIHFTAGTYLSAPLTLPSNTYLLFDKGATLLGSPDMADYPIRADAPWRRVSLLHADHAANIRITGPGTIDGNGE